MSETLDLEAIERNLESARELEDERSTWTATWTLVTEHAPALLARVRELDERILGLYRTEYDLNERIRQLEAALAAATLAERERCLAAAVRFIKERGLCYPSELLSVENGIREFIEADALACPTCHAPLQDGTDTANVGGETRHCRCLGAG